MKLLISSVFIIIFISLNLFAAENIERGKLRFEDRVAEVSKYIDKNGMLHLSNIRSTCRFLVDDEQMIKYKKSQTLLKKRKKAFKRHVKTICEKLEEAYLLKAQFIDEHEEILMELELYKKSLILKTKSDLKGVTLLDKIKMKISGTLSKWRNQFLMILHSKNIESFNISYDDGETKENFSQKDPVSSFFWHAQNPNLKRHKNFKNLEKLKKIKIKSEMIVLFDKPSLDGSAPKIKTLDLDLDNAWTLKWGDELHADALGSRIFAAFGYDVDHPYVFRKNKLILVFPKIGPYQNIDQLKEAILKKYKVDLSKFIFKNGVITQEMVTSNSKLAEYLGNSYVKFNKAALEARPDRVKRIGHMASGALLNEVRRELRGSVLLHMWIGNWDTREENTMLTTIHMGNHKYRGSAAFNDLGTSFGMHINTIPADFKAGLVNHFSPHLVRVKRDLLLRKKIKFDHIFNHFNPFFKKVTYSDLKWMAIKLETLKEKNLRKMIKEANWPAPIAELYYNKLASRRKEILNVFDIRETNPWIFDIHKTISYKGEVVVKNGMLIKEIDTMDNPEGFIHKFGRFRNYGGVR